MKVEIAKEKENGTKFIASFPTEEGVVTQNFDSWRGLRAYLREEKKKAEATGQPFELVRKSN